MKNFFIIIILVCGFFLPGDADSISGLMTGNGVWISNSGAFEGDNVKVSTIVVNDDVPFMSMRVSFYNKDDSLIGSVFVDKLKFEEPRQIWLYYELPYGEELFRTRISNVYGTDENGEGVPIDLNKLNYLQVSNNYFIDRDTDGDGTGDKVDDDDDNDGLSDEREEQLGTDPSKADTDEDGLTDNEEVTKGTDPLKVDTDEDGLNDKEEINSGLDPLKADTDGDGCNDKIDKFPLDQKECKDEDSDGIGDNEEARIEKERQEQAERERLEKEAAAQEQAEEIAREDNPTVAEADEVFTVETESGVDSADSNQKDSQTEAGGNSDADDVKEEQEQVLGVRETAAELKLLDKDSGSGNLKLWLVIIAGASFLFFLVFYGIYYVKKAKTGDRN